MNDKQLKLAKLFAELEGAQTYEFEGKLFISVYMGAGCSFENRVVYNPFKGQLQLDARDKYQAEIDYDEDGMGSVGIWQECEWETKSFKSADDIGMAVIECILKSKGKLP